MKLFIQKSSVHGEGIFTECSLKQDDVIPIEENVIIIEGIKEINKDYNLEFKRICDRGYFLQAWFLVFHILFLETVPDWFSKLHKEIPLRKEMGALDKEILTKCFEKYYESKIVLEIFDIVVTNFLKGRDNNTYGISEITSKLNHNKDYNVLTLIENKTLYIKATRDINAGEELFIKYPEEYYPL